MTWHLIFQVISVCAWAFSVITVVRPLCLERRRTLLVSALLALAFGKFAFFALAGGNTFNPDLPQYVIWAYGWAYGAAMLLTAFVFAAFVIDFGMLLLHRPVKVKTKRIRTAALAVVAVFMAVWGMYEGVRVPSVKRLELAFEGLPAALDGYRIVHLSDLHCSTAARRAHFERIVEVVNALDADLVAITGDFVDGFVEDRRNDLAPLADLRAKDGVLACSGNHEAYWDWIGWRGALLGWGIVFPEETGPVLIRRGESVLAVGGMPDPALGDKTPPEFAYDAVDCFKGMPKGAFRILLSHRPLTDIISTASDDADIRLQLSGHTHGGAMPVLSLLVAFTNEGHVRGLYEFAPGRYLHVSPGTGQWAGFPLRLFNPTEITEIVLKPVKPRQI